MAGNAEGAKKAAATTKRKHGADFHQRIGRKGGSAEYEGEKGFAANRELARIAGAKGGFKSRKTKGA